MPWRCWKFCPMSYNQPLALPFLLGIVPLHDSVAFYRSSTSSRMHCPAKIFFIFFAVVAAVACANLLIGAAFFMLVVDLILLPLIIPYVLLPLWFAFIQLKNIYVKELVQSSKNKMMEKKQNYDLVDEQLVKGLNC